MIGKRHAPVGARLCRGSAYLGVAFVSNEAIAGTSGPTRLAAFDGRITSDDRAIAGARYLLPANILPLFHLSFETLHDHRSHAYRAIAHRRPPPPTSPCSTTALPSSTAASSSCASKTPISCARPVSRNSRSSTLYAGWASSGTKARTSVARTALTGRASVARSTPSTPRSWSTPVMPSTASAPPKSSTKCAPSKWPVAKPRVMTVAR